jgi:hypothetical protein
MHRVVAQVPALALLWLSVLVAPAAVAMPQARGSQDSSRSVMAVLARVPPGSRLRVHAPGFGRLEGQLTTRSDTLLHVRSTNVESQVPLAGIDSIWVRESHPEKGAVVGAIIGALAGGFVFAIAGSGEPFCGVDSGNCESKAGLFAKGALTGGIIGSLLGVAIGSHRWRLDAP